MSKLYSFVKYISPSLASGHLPVDLAFCYEIIVDNLGKYMNMMFFVFYSEKRSVYLPDTQGDKQLLRINYETSCFTRHCSVTSKTHVIDLAEGGTTYYNAPL